AKRSLVQRAIMSPMLITKVPGIGGTSIQPPSCSTCSPPTSPCARMVKAVVSECGRRPNCRPGVTGGWGGEGGRLDCGGRRCEGGGGGESVRARGPRG